MNKNLTEEEYSKYEEIFKIIEQDWRDWAEKTNAKKMVIGISGGKDSSVCATLAVKIFGIDNVIGVLMPQYNQVDINYSKEIINFLNIKSYFIDIGESTDSIINGLYDAGIVVSDDTRINLPARIRMSTLFAVAQSINGRVINTSNLSENMIGYSTLFGDNAGTFAPISDLTVTEVIKLGQFLKIPEKFLIKPPTDGLCGKTDEEKLGFSYSDLDNLIRNDIGKEDFKLKIKNLYKKNEFKLNMVQIPHPQFGFPNYINHDNVF